MYEEKIEEKRKKMYKCINKSGIRSNETMKKCKQLDKVINRYYHLGYSKTNIILYYYNKSFSELIKYAKKEGFPNCKKWNRYAYKNGYLSNISIEYISGLKWKELKNYFFKV